MSFLSWTWPLQMVRAEQRCSTYQRTLHYCPSSVWELCNALTSIVFIWSRLASFGKSHLHKLFRSLATETRVTLTWLKTDCDRSESTPYLLPLGHGKCAWYQPNILMETSLEIYKMWHTYPKIDAYWNLPLNASLSHKSNSTIKPHIYVQGGHCHSYASPKWPTKWTAIPARFRIGIAALYSSLLRVSTAETANPGFMNFQDGRSYRAVHGVTWPWGLRVQSALASFFGKFQPPWFHRHFKPTAWDLRIAERANRCVQ